MFLSNTLATILYRMLRSVLHIYAMFHCSVILSMQTLGEHELRSNEHLPGDSPGPYPAVNHAGAFPPTTYTSTMGNEGPPHMAIVSIRFISLHARAPFADG